MPELPEVEVVKRSLRKNITNLTIKKVKINIFKLRYSINKRKFSLLKNHKIKSIERRSKYLLFILNKDLIILCHLGMTGKFYIQKNKKRSKTSFYYKIKEREDKHNHLIFYFNKKISLIYNDVRRFGFIKIIHKNNIKNISHLKNLGPEPMSKDFNKKYFCHYIKKIKKRSIKNLLMDQKFVAGLGNIYVNEILFLSKISPLKKVSSIKNEKFSIIIKTIKKILKISIKEGGSSIKDFSSSEGEEGSFQQQFKVYGKKDENCPTPECSGLIERIVISGRATFYCKICQK